MAKELKPCNCRVKTEYPLNGQCWVTNIIYKCTALSPDKPNNVYLVKAISRNNFIIIASHLPTRLTETTPFFQYVYIYIYI